MGPAASFNNVMVALLCLSGSASFRAWSEEFKDRLICYGGAELQLNLYAVHCGLMGRAFD